MAGDIRYEHPLKYPPRWVPTPQNSRSQKNNFPRSLTLAEAIRYLEEEVRTWKAYLTTVYSSYQYLNNERLRKKIANDSGVSVSIKIGLTFYHITCDKWYLIEHNIYAIHLALRAMRNIEEWGIASKESLLGLSAPAPTREMAEAAHDVQLPEWMTALGLGPTATIEDANAVYRRRAKMFVEDEEGLLGLNNAMDEARKHLD